MMDQALLEIIEDYGSESRWVGHYHTVGDHVSEQSARQVASELLDTIKGMIATEEEKQCMKP